MLIPVGFCPRSLDSSNRLMMDLYPVGHYNPMDEAGLTRCWWSPNKQKPGSQRTGLALVKIDPNSFKN